MTTDYGSFATIEDARQWNGARIAHHEAGHAVAAAWRGGVIDSFSLGLIDWARKVIDADGEVTGDSTGDKHGFVDYRDAPLDADPFILYAGLWAEARHLSERHGTNLDEQLMTTWLAHALNSAESAGESDVTKFERAMYDSFGSTPNKLTVESWWESAFSTELGHLWPAIAAVAADALAGVEVTHAVVDRHIGE